MIGMTFGEVGGGGGEGGEGGGVVKDGFVKYFSDICIHFSF